MMMERWEGEEERGSRGSFRSSKARCPGLVFRQRVVEDGKSGLCVLPVHADHQTRAAGDV